MIDNSKLSINSSILDSFISETIQNEKYIIEKNPKDNFWYMKNKSENYYNILSIDTTKMISGFAKKLIGLNFNSILISGLGLGIIPYMCQDSTEIIDVVEIDDKVIELTNSIGHLKSNINIISSNISEYNCEKTYDVILFDHWMDYTSQQEMLSLQQKFSPFLNEGGLITIPIHEQMYN